MAKFGLVIDGKLVPVQVVGSMTWGGQQSVVIYEAPGSDAGSIVLTGRTTKTKTLSGKLLRVGTLSLTDIKNYFEAVRDAGKTVTLASPADDADTKQYIISDFNGSVLEGIESYFPFTMELTEKRQANVKKAVVNLIAFEPAERIRKLIKDLGGVPQ